MALPDFAYAGAAAPEAFKFDVLPSETVPDLSVISAAELEVRRPGESADVIWSDPPPHPRDLIVAASRAQGPPVTEIWAYDSEAWLDSDADETGCRTLLTASVDAAASWAGDA